ncbi:MAG TPA: transglycosylase SLT domain-containing protein [Stellaceae bacterium]|nr:transglycosylase SLT domain-containing protein [Stellaceae bacterium]
MDLSTRSTSSGSAQPIKGADSAVVQDIRKASAATHVDFGYLMAQAAQESGFDPQAKASSSSATGLFQFIDSTWLTMVRKHGADHGIGHLADQIDTSSSGSPVVHDPVVKQQILNLRTDPKISSVIAAEFAKDNSAALESALGRKASGTDLYMAHFLGAGGASDFLSAMKANSSTKAADILPGAAAANPSVFYDQATGAAKSVADIYQRFAAKIGKAAQSFTSTGDASDMGSTGADTTALRTNSPTFLAQFKAALGIGNVDGGSLGGWQVSALMDRMIMTALRVTGDPDAARRSAATTSASTPAAASIPDRVPAADSQASAGEVAAAPTVPPADPSAKPRTDLRDI